jgi:hypothetical protein
MRRRASAISAWWCRAAAGGVLERAEGGLVEDALQGFVAAAGAPQVADLAGLFEDRGEPGCGGEPVGCGEAADAACLGDELGGQRRPHAGQAADEGGVRVAGERLLELRVERGQSLADGERLLGELAHQVGGDSLARDGGALRSRGGDRLLGEPLDVGLSQLAGTQEVAEEPRLAGASDLGRRGVPAQEPEARFAGRVDDLLEAGMDRGEQVAQPAESARLVGDKLASAPDQEAQLGIELAAELERPQIVAAADELGDHARVARVALVLAAGRALPGPVDREARHVDEHQPSFGKHRREQRRDPADHVDADGRGTVLALKPEKLVEQRLDRRRPIADATAQEHLARLSVDRRRPVELLRDVDPNRHPHLAPFVAGNHAQSLRAVLALHSDWSQSPISGREEKAEQGVVPPEPSTAASMKTIPAPPAHPALDIRSAGHEQKGRAA